MIYSPYSLIVLDERFKILKVKQKTHHKNEKL